MSVSLEMALEIRACIRSPFSNPGIRFIFYPVFAAHVIEQNVRRQLIVLAGRVGVLYQLCQLGAVGDLIRVPLASVAARVRIRC